jgi:hypothetical protein
MTRPRTTIILCVIAALGATGAALVERAAPSGVVRSRGDTRPLFAESPLPVEQVNQITLTRAGEPPLLFLRGEDDTWEQTRPFPHPLDRFSVQQILQLAAEVEIVKTLDPEGLDEALSPETLGLEPPAAELSLDWPGGSVTMRLGRRSIAGRAYMLVDDEPGMLVVNAALHDRVVDMDPKEWRDRTIFRDVGVDSDRIEMIGAGEDVVLARDRKKWLMEQPISARLNALARDELMQALGRAQVNGFVLDDPDDLGRFGLAPPVASVTVTTTRVESDGGAVARTPEVQRLLVGQRIFGTDARYGMVEGRPTVVRLNEPVLRALFRQPADLASAIASGVEPADVKSIRIDGPGGDFRLERDLERWIAPDHGSAEVAPEHVERLLEILCRVHAPNVAIETFPRDASVASITMRGYGQRVLDTVRVAFFPGATPADARWVLENGDNVLRVFAESLQPPLRPRDFGLQDLTE